MKRFLPITRELSLIRETHRVLIQYLRLSPGATLTCSAALSKKDLRRARCFLQEASQTGEFENELGQVAWHRTEKGIQLCFMEEGHRRVELLLEGPEWIRWREAMADLTPGT